MDDDDLKLSERHIVSAYERIDRQRQLIRRLRRHRRHPSEVSDACELLRVMEAICKQFRVHRRIIQRELHRPAGR
jgi:hypothetical protein